MRPRTLGLTSSISSSENSRLRGPTSSRVGELRERLHRSGALCSSRSAISRQDATPLDDFVVDVGDGEIPNLEEHLLARLEQHGLRRCFNADEDLSSYTVARSVRDGGGPSSSLNLPMAENTRKPYYYLCVPCEMRLTAVSTTPATHEMLEDAHYHFASATHRRAASWMADPDIDETLTESPQIDKTAYTRIYVNGVPMLLSRRPGGGDMFYALPHEHDSIRSNRTVRRQNVETVMLGVPPDKDRSQLFPSAHYSSDACMWYRPLATFDTGCKQVVTLSPSATPALQDTRNMLLQSALRRSVVVAKVPIDVYESHTEMGREHVPLYPALFRVTRKRLGKATLEGKRPREEGEDGHRTVYVLGYPCRIRAPESELRASHLITEHGCGDRCVVDANSVFRVALLSRTRLRAYQMEERSNEPAPSVAAPQLTRELLSQVASQSALHHYGSSQSVSGWSSSTQTSSS